jgi:hypothetical protein
LDSGQGSWVVKYDSVAEKEKIAIAVRNTGTGRWKEARAVVKDAYFGNRCPHSTDLMLLNTSNEDTLFHMIEVSREIR